MVSYKISPTQLFCLMVLFELGSAIVVGTGIQAKQDAWMVILLGMACGFTIFLIYCYLFQQYPTQPLTGYLRKILGKFIGIPLSLIYVFYFFYIAARVLRDFGTLMVTTTLPDTPLYVVNGMMMLIISYGVYKGIEVIARTGETVFFIVFLLGILGILAAVCSGLVKPERLFPMLENGWKPILTTAFSQTYPFPFGEIIAFTMIFPNLSQPQLGKKAGLSALFVSGFLLAIFIALEITILGSTGVSASHFPLLEMISKVNVANFIQRLDMIVVLTFILGVFIKIMIFFYAGIYGFSDIFHFNSSKQMKYCILIFSVLILFSSIKIASNDIEHLNIGLKWVPIYLHLPLQTGIPILLFFTTLIRNKVNKTTT